ncbi:MAG TPA: hypothetical protein PKK48_04460 [Phycisphaerae bacterium]|nr:hypothetical protein [Phycisphaerae bacterium]HPS52595.1 hypothetical protein [Phycisphaerae bacterium]
MFTLRTFTNILRVIAKIYAGVMALLIVMFLVGENGLVNPFVLPLSTAIKFFCIWAICIGCMAGWKWQGAGGIIVIAGVLVFHIVEKRFWLAGLFPFFDVAGILYLISWLLWKKVDFKGRSTHSCG